MIVPHFLALPLAGCFLQLTIGHVEICALESAGRAHHILVRGMPVGSVGVYLKRGLEAMRRIWGREENS